MATISLKINTKAVRTDNVPAEFAYLKLGAQDFFTLCTIAGIAPESTGSTTQLLQVLLAAWLEPKEQNVVDAASTAIATRVKEEKWQEVWVQRTEEAKKRAEAKKTTK